MLANTIDLVRNAHKHGLAVAAINTYNLELTHAILRAAERLSQPVIIQLGVPVVKAYGASLVQAAVVSAQQARVPVALHLDHCKDLALIQQCLAWGCSSALADGSHLSFAENKALTQQAVALAASYNAAIEGELGYLAGTEDGVTVEQVAASLTDPQQAREFVTQTGLAMLAVAIGNVHGYIPDPPPLDFTRLQQIATQVEIPLVLHGASGISKEKLQSAIKLGVAKVNFNTEVRSAFLQAIALWGQRVGSQVDVRRKGHDFLDMMQEAMAAAESVIAEIIKTCAMIPPV
jgi:tagatose 1,6-diphosphate aldolase GatY/KbaY